MDTGDCPSGCMEGWIGKHCIIVIPIADKQGTGKPSFFTLAVVLLVLFTVLIGFVVFLITYSKRYTSSQHNDESPLEDSETENQETDTECKDN